MRRLNLFCFFTFYLLSLPIHAADEPGVNADVLRIACSFKDGGGYNTAWKGTGTAEEINFKGEKILACGDKTYCCGFTFTVVMRAATERRLLKDKSPQQIRKFQKEWYGATQSSAEKQCQLAMKNLDIGEAIAFDEAQPGDFVQLWRAKSGHSVIFLNWVEENGQKIGFHYRSSQTGTDGIGDATEYFTKAKPGHTPLNKERTYFCRLNPPSK